MRQLSMYENLYIIFNINVILLECVKSWLTVITNHFELSRKWSSQTNSYL
jgi:hypothetical protein